MPTGSTGEDGRLPAPENPPVRGRRGGDSTGRARSNAGPASSMSARSG